MWRRVARRALQRLDGLLQPGEDVGLALRLDARDLALQVVDGAERRGPYDPVRLLVERHDAELVALGHGRGRPQDGLLADVDLARAIDLGAAAHPALERVAVAGVHRARLVDDDDERDIRLLLAVAHAHVDRQGLLERRLLVAAGAVRIGPADHDQALAQVADVDLQGRQLAIGHARPGDVDEDDAVVGREGPEVGRHRLRHDRCRRAGAGSRGPRRARRRQRRRRPARACAARP